VSDRAEQAALAADGEQFAVHSNGGNWLIAWHSPLSVPEGTPHGANAFCITLDDQIVLISGDGERWGWPGGRPEGDESWEQTLRREVLEEVCATVSNARLLGFCRAVCLSGSERTCAGSLHVACGGRADAVGTTVRDPTPTPR